MLHATRLKKVLIDKREKQLLVIYKFYKLEIIPSLSSYHPGRHDTHTDLILLTKTHNTHSEPLQNKKEKHITHITNINKMRTRYGHFDF